MSNTDVKYSHFSSTIGCTIDKTGLFSQLFQLSNFSKKRHFAARKLLSSHNFQGKEYAKRHKCRPQMLQANHNASSGCTVGTCSTKKNHVCCITTTV